MSKKKTIKKTMSDLHASMVEARVGHGHQAAKLYLANKRLTENTEEMKKLTIKIERALTEGKSEFAKASIERQKKLKTQIPVLENCIKKAIEREKELEKLIYDLQIKKLKMKNKTMNCSNSKNYDVKSYVGIKDFSAIKNHVKIMMAHGESKHYIEDKLRNPIVKDENNFENLT